MILGSPIVNLLLYPCQSETEPGDISWKYALGLWADWRYALHFDENKIKIDEANATLMELGGSIGVALMDTYVMTFINWISVVMCFVAYDSYDISQEFVAFLAENPNMTFSQARSLKKYSRVVVSTLK